MAITFKKYSLQFARWIMEKSTVTVTVQEGNTKLSDDSLIVFGYDVSGLVVSDDEPVSGVSFLLFGVIHTYYLISKNISYILY